MYIRTATLNDAGAIGELVETAMAPDELSRFLMPYGDAHPLCKREAVVRRRRRCFYNPSYTMLVMATDSADQDWDGNEQIVGHIAVSTTSPPSVSLTQRFWLGLNSYLHSAEDTARWYLHSDRSQSNANMSDFLRTQSTVDESDYLVPKGRDHHFVQMLAVSPEHQRKGIGRALVKHAQGLAAAEKMPLLLVSSPFGEKLYLSCGFKELAQLPIASGMDRTSPLMLWESPLAEVTKSS
jgi:ribosomal protein S18 acetylase RimI-like enzyme